MALRPGWCYVADVGDVAAFDVQDRFAGPWARGHDAPRTGAMRGLRDATHIVAELTTHVDAEPTPPVDAGAGRRVRVSGFVQIDGLCARAACTGEGRLFVADPEVGMKRCEYRLEVAPIEGPAVNIYATCFVRPGRMSRTERETLYVRVVSAENPAIVIGAGVIRRRARDRWRALLSRAPADARWRRFVQGEIGVPMSPVAS